MCVDVDMLNTRNSFISFAYWEPRETSMLDWMVASLGAFGESLRHAERDMHRWTRNLYDSKLEKYHLKLHVPWGLT